jgi:hypothetical protein
LAFFVVQSIVSNGVPVPLPPGREVASKQEIKMVDEIETNDEVVTEPIEGEENTPPTQGEENESVVPEETADENWNEEFEKKGPEAITKEARRMREKIAKLEAANKARESETPKPVERQPEQLRPEQKFDPIEYLSRTAENKADLAHLKRMGMDDDGIRAWLNIAGRWANEIAGNRIEPIASEFREGKFAKAMDAFSKTEDNKFAMSKPEIKADMESYIRKTFNPNQWTDPEVMNAAFGLALKKNLKIFTQGSREIVDDVNIHSKGDGGQTNSSAGISEIELSGYAESIGYKPGDIKDKVVRKAVIEAYKAKMAAGTK